MQTCDELPFALGWIAPEPRLMQRASHALATDAGVYLVDPVDVPGAEQRVRDMGRPAGVILLLDRHGRDGQALAGRLGVPLHRVPFGGVTGSPFEFIRVVDLPRWKEVALWWPERRVLVVADALGTARYMLAPGERLAVGPLLRLLPPRQLDLGAEHVLCGHGAGLHGPDAASALHEAIAAARRRAPAWLGTQAAQAVRSRRAKRR